MNFEIPEKLLFLLNKNARYKVAYGGRGSGKSWSVARSLILLALKQKHRILCTRQLQTSIKDSVHKLLCDSIDALGFNQYFEITRDAIRCKNGSEFIFKGLQNQTNEIKSIEGIDYCWCFVAGTLIDGKPIEEYKPGDYVWSYDHKNNRHQYNRVIRVTKRKNSEKIYKLLTSAGLYTIIATGNHPIYVKGRGYVPLAEIQKGDIVYATKIKPSGICALFRWLRNNDSDRHSFKTPKICKKWWSLLQRLYKKNELGKNEKTQSDVKHSFFGKNEEHTKKHKPQTPYVRGQRSRLYKSTKIINKKTGAWLVVGAGSSNRQTSGTSDKLQNRYSEYILRDSHRDRRWLALWRAFKTRGQEKRRFLEEQRVESVTLQESRSLKKLGLCDGGDYVYNLEVQGTNNYFANRLLVHNCEEAQSISKDSWEILIPTIRKEGSEIWVTFNPDRDEDATFQRFIKNPPPDSIVQLVNYNDNPWFPDVLRNEMTYDKEVDFGKYEHIWLGKTVIDTDAQIYHGKFELKEFVTPSSMTFYYGADWGFANDPTAIVRCFIQDQCLYIDYEAGGVGVEFEELPSLFDSIPEIRKWDIRADNARPETISYMSRQGYKVKACPKWKGSVEDGIEYIRSFRRIYVHTRCKRTYEEFKFYSYKQDKNTGDILPIVLDKDNHYMDALRYALNPYIQKNISILEVL